MALDQQESRLRMQLSRIKVTLLNQQSDAGVAKRIAQDPNESAKRRAEFKAKYEALNKEIEKNKKLIAQLEKDIKVEQARKNVIEVKSNYDRLKKQYDLVIDKQSPEAKRLADRVNAEVKKLNKAYADSGSSTRVKPIGAVATPVTQPNVVSAASMPFGGGAIPGMQGVSGPISGGIPVSGTTPAGTVSASTGATPTGGSVGTAAGTGPSGAATTPEQRYAEAVLKAQQLYNMPDIIFKNVKSLGDLLKRFVDKELTIEQFAREIQNDPWYRQNSDEIKARYVQLFNYQDLVKTGRAQGTTNYEQELARITRSVQAEARRLRGTDIPEADAKLMAQDLYIFNLDGDTAAVTERLARFITPTAGMVAGQPTTGYGGQALQNYQTLQALSKANGYKIEDVLPRDAAGNPMTAESTLQGLATGKLDIGRIAQDIRKLAAQGQPDYVKQLLAQGYDLDQIYAPYKSRMAAILELNPDAINLNDSALRMGINKDGDLNLYDYEKMLRKDTRWQYTKNAREEVSNAAYQVLRDFGFQG